MTPISHALLPVLFGRKVISNINGVPVIREVLIVSICGAFPDMLSPHLSLDARHASLSHSVFALVFFACFIGAVSFYSSLLRRLGFLCVFAYAAHIFCDLISGGVSLFYPYSFQVFGGGYMPFWFWITSDLALILYLYFVYRWIPLRKKASHSKIPAPSISNEIL
jgi:hypothetical protein